MGDSSERSGSGMKDDLSMEIDPPFKENLATAEDWRKALQKVVPAVVVLRTTACRAFDTESAGASYATGFVVDKSRGIILTNRHVTKPGPVVAEAMFVNREEIPVYPIYRDPVHDFGFFRYDPAAIQFLSYEEIPLAPDAACVGLEIRVVGNDSGEKVSILAGTLARLDRDAPYYKKYALHHISLFYIALKYCVGSSEVMYEKIEWNCKCNIVINGENRMATVRFLAFEKLFSPQTHAQRATNRMSTYWDGYNDFNTFYMQAASGTKGGSSGSPVIDWQGRAVALNAGSKSSSASAFFLPLERVVRALTFLQKGRDSFQDKWEAVTIPRGTLQATFLHKGFDETRRLGLRSEIEQLVRHASPLSETGMLVVDSVVPGGPAHKQLEPGDVLVRMNREVISQFLKMENLLDDSVGQNVELELERGGRPLTVQLTVQDLHSITPHYFLEVSGAVIHPLSYQQARNFRFQCGLVYVSEPGAGVPRHAIIKKFAGEAISQLEDLISVLSKLSRGARVPMEYISYMDRHRRKSVLVTVDRHEWYASPQIYTRDDNSGLWIIKQALPLDCPLISFGTKNIKQGLINHVVLGTTDNCLVEHVHGDLGKQLVNGVSSTKTSSSTKPHDQAESDSGTKKRRVGEELSTDGSMLADYTLNEPKIESQEDREDAAVTDHYGTAAIFGNASVAEQPALRRGDSVYLVGLSRSLQATSRKSVVTNPCAALNISSADSPRYRAINMEVIELDTDFGSTFSGVLTDENGRVKAIWGSFSTQLKYGCNTSEDHQFVRGIPIYTISLILKKILSGAKGPSLLINGIKRPMPLVRILEVELYPTLLSKARSFGLSDHWIQALVKKDPVRRQVLCVKGCLAGSKAENLLAQGDMVLAINKKPITCFRDIEDACQALDQYDATEGKLGLTIFRQGHEIDLLVGTDVRDGNGTTRVINWCGCFLQDSHPAVRTLGFLPDEGHGVYVTRWSHGSPVHRYGLYALQWIVEVNGKPTPDLNAFVDVTKEIENGEFVRVKTVHLNGKPRVQACNAPDIGLGIAASIVSMETVSTIMGGGKVYRQRAYSV
ncbi:PDZ domain-containing protein [Cynara cardunculus var. scolymus]|uniref:PDZ domain-containing protein n=1 Tax=Cynara cardunculus var. scolymus TaxID=59895 RepID=A0A103YGY4_CYNCS|nr:PDZ domain-containing protein [Cynara cardunculus var. scolymus]